MSIDALTIRERWFKEKPEYERFAKHIEEELCNQIRIRGLWARTSARAKEVDSFIKKVFRKGYTDPFLQMPDKAGVRVITKFLDDLKEVQSIVEKNYEIVNCEDKSQILDFNDRRFAHFPPNLLKSLDRGFAKSVSSPLQSIEYKGLMEMTEPRVMSLDIQVFTWRLNYQPHRFMIKFLISPA
jgi:hypothetical protein